MIISKFLALKEDRPRVKFEGKLHESTLGFSNVDRICDYYEENPEARLESCYSRVAPTKEKKIPGERYLNTYFTKSTNSCLNLGLSHTSHVGYVMYQLSYQSESPTYWSDFNSKLSKHQLRLCAFIIPNHQLESSQDSFLSPIALFKKNESGIVSVYEIDEHQLQEDVETLLDTAPVKTLDLSQLSSFEASMTTKLLRPSNSTKQIPKPDFNKSIMLGAIAGDIIGSRFEWDNYKAKDFELLHQECQYTDDTVLTMAVAQGVKEVFTSLYSNRVVGVGIFKKYIKDFALRYPGRGYGGMFSEWINNEPAKPYGSYGNGSAMRASACGWKYHKDIHAMRVARNSALVTHNHPEGVKGAEAVAAAIFYARTGKSKDFIKEAITSKFDYDLSVTCDEIRPDYEFNETCQETVPQAIVAFLESKNFEDAIRTAISLGGDSDTLAAITGSIAEAYYGGVGDEIGEFIWGVIPEEFQEIVSWFNG